MVLRRKTPCLEGFLCALASKDKPTRSATQAPSHHVRISGHLRGRHLHCAVEHALESRYLQHPCMLAYCSSVALYLSVSWPTPVASLCRLFLVPLLGLVDHMNRLLLEVVVGRNDAFLVKRRFNAALAHAAQRGHAKGQFSFLGLGRQRRSTPQPTSKRKRVIIPRKIR